MPHVQYDDVFGPGVMPAQRQILSFLCGNFPYFVLHLFPLRRPAKIYIFFFGISVAFRIFDDVRGRQIGGVQFFRPFPEGVNFRKIGRIIYDDPAVRSRLFRQTAADFRQRAFVLSRPKTQPFE